LKLAHADFASPTAGRWGVAGAGRKPSGMLSRVPGAVHFVREEQVRDRVRAAWARESAVLRWLLPQSDLQHVGSTAVPGSLTKGDLDVQVRVAAEAFERAERVLAAHYPRNALSTRLPGAFAAFVSRGRAVEIGIQLTSMHGAVDTFWRFREVLRAREYLRQRFDALKRAHEGLPMAVYRAAKDRFLEELRTVPEFARARLP
jgi:GrpB-like predicted nucleotidyltransferase (UPF0157 family)